MISAFADAVGTALTSFVTDVTGAISDNAATVLPITFGVVGIFLVLGVVLRLAKKR